MFHPYDTREAIDFLKNKPLQSVTHNDSRDEITFLCQDGSYVTFGVEGDCCSHSWIEHLTVPDDIEGAVILRTDSNSDDETENDRLNPRSKQYEDDGPTYRHYECLQVYQTIFYTTKGEIALEFRNSSNGYYGGSLVVNSSGNVNSN